MTHSALRIELHANGFYFFFQTTELTNLLMAAGARVNGGEEVYESNGKIAANV